MRHATLTLDEPAATYESVGFPSWLAGGTHDDGDAWQRRADAIRDATPRQGSRDARTVPTRRPGTIDAISLDGRGHGEGAGMQSSDHPRAFSKYAISTTAPHDPIDAPEGLTMKVDVEVELVVIERTARRVGRSNALTHVSSNRVLLDPCELQLDDASWVHSTSFDTVGPVHAWVTTTDEAAAAHPPKFHSSADDDPLQDDVHEDMVFSVTERMQRRPHAFPPEPGDVIATGTAAGVGFARRSRGHVRLGNLIDTERDGLGPLRTIAHVRRRHDTADERERTSSERNA